MTNKEAVTYGNELIQCTTGQLREFAEIATRALRSPGAAEMREAAIACVREQAPPRDIRTVVTEAQVSVLDRAIAAIRALPLPAPEDPDMKIHAADEWHDAIGTVLWWSFPIDEPPYVGTPLNSDWPGYHTHWTRLAFPEESSWPK